MADSIRQTVVDAFKTRLATITTGNGYETSIGSNVKEWYTGDANDAVLPMVNIVDEDVEIRLDADDLGVIRMGKERHEMRLRFEVRLSNGTSTSTTLRKAVADVYKALGTDRTMGGLCKDIRPRNDRIELEQQDKVIGLANIEISAFYETNLLNPYS